VGVGGYTGRVLLVDLSNKTIKTIEFSESTLKMFLGGSGLGAKILYDMLREPEKVDPLSPQNPLIFMTGPLTGSPFPTSGRFSVVAKSPLTNIYGEANAGGFWGAELKFAGYDGIIVTGRAREPVYITIFDGNVEIHKANHLWGMDTIETERTIRRDHGDPKIRVACIGRAGERRIPIACIICDEGRAAGRTGLGAVMGSKNLKAIAVRGTGKIEYYDEGRLVEYCKDVTLRISKSPYTESIRKYGTNRYMLIGYRFGDIPIKNWTKGVWDEIEKISGEEMAKRIVKKAIACYNCPIACGRYIEITSGPYAGIKGHGPEYETCASIGALCLLSDIEAIAKANDMCTRYGVDTISIGGIIAFAIECFEKGLITEKDTEGIKLEWGSAEAILKLIELIVEGRGIGRILSQGVARASKAIKGSEEYAIHVKGLEVPMHDPRAWTGLALQYATMPRGACHLALAYTIERGIVIPELGFTEDFVRKLDRFSPEHKPQIVKTMQDYMGVFDSLVICKFSMFAGVKPSDIVRALKYTTGWDITLSQLLEIGERIFNIKRAFNVKCGIRRKDDTLPKRLLTPLSEGGAKGHAVRLEPLLDEYYRIRGWSSNGVPLREKLEELGLSEVARDMEKYS